MKKTPALEITRGLNGNHDCQRSILVEKVQLKSAFA